jgi:hypothetical protein
MFDQDTCTVHCIPGYARANTTFLCDNKRQVDLVDIRYMDQDQALAEGSPPEYARYVNGVKVPQYSLKLTFPWCEPLECTTGGFSLGFSEGAMSATIYTIEPFRRVM